MLLPIALRALLVVIVFAAASSAAAAPLEPVELPAAEPGVRLQAHLALPSASGPVPALVFLHGCSGLAASGRIYRNYQAWTDRMIAAGYAVLMIDSAGSRGFGKTCSAGDERRRMYRERPGDAYAGLAFLQGLGAIDPSRVGLIGWSQGGAIALLAIASGSAARPMPPPAHDFRAAVAFYPGACSDRLQSRPYTGVEPGSWQPVAPLLVLQGGSDNWTLPGPCIAFVEAVRARGHPAEIVVYPSALHSFDVPGMAVRPRIDVVTSRGEHPLVGTDEAARQDAYGRVDAFLHRYLMAP